MWIRQQVGLDIGVRIRSVLGHLQEGVWRVGGLSMMTSQPQTSQQQDEFLPGL